MTEQNVEPIQTKEITEVDVETEIEIKYDFICGNCGLKYNRPKRFHCIGQDFCKFACLQEKCDGIREAKLLEERRRIDGTRRLPK
jgi:hypothetical protein